jgi:hypothetical protein
LWEELRREKTYREKSDRVVGGNVSGTSVQEGLCGEQACRLIIVQGTEVQGGNVQRTNMQEKVSRAFLGSNMHKRSFWRSNKIEQAHASNKNLIKFMIQSCKNNLEENIMHRLKKIEECY